MKKCLRQKCSIEFEPVKPKQVYCSTKCRTYAYREKKAAKAIEPVALKKEVMDAAKTAPSDKKVKEMPAGLDKGAMLRWLRENS